MAGKKKSPCKYYARYDPILTRQFIATALRRIYQDMGIDDKTEGQLLDDAHHLMKQIQNDEDVCFKGYEEV